MWNLIFQSYHSGVQNWRSYWFRTEVGIRMKKLKKYMKERDWVRLEITLDMFRGRYFFGQKVWNFKKSSVVKKIGNSVLVKAKTFCAPLLFVLSTYHEPGVQWVLVSVYFLIARWKIGLDNNESNEFVFWYVSCWNIFKKMAPKCLRSPKQQNPLSQSHRWD